MQNIAKSVKKRLPINGEVRILPLTDSQWSTAFRFSNGTPEKQEETPQQLEIF